MSLSSSPSFIYSYRRLWPLLRPSLGYFALGLLCAALVGFFEALTPLGIKLYLEGVIEHHTLPTMLQELPRWVQPVVKPLTALLPAANSTVWQITQQAWLIPAGIVGFTLVQGGFHYAATLFNALVNVNLNAALRHQLYQTLLHKEPAYFDQSHTGEILQRYSGDVDQATSGLTDQLKTAVVRAFTVLGLALTLLSLSWKLALLALLVLSSIIVPLQTSRRYVKRINEEAILSSAELSTHYTEALQGNRIIHTFQLQGFKIQQFWGSVRRQRRIGLRMARLMGLLTPFMHVIAGLGIGLVLFFGTELIQSGEMSTGGFAAFITSLILLYTPIKSLGHLSTQVQLAYLALQRVFALQDTPSQLVFPPTPATNADTPPFELKHALRLENLHFQYGPHLPEVLKGINLTIPKGHTVALVGASGSGKSTLAHLVLRLYDPTAGTLWVDETPLHQLNRQQLGHLCSAVFQDNFIFVGSVEDNLRLTNPTATEDELWAALEGAHLKTFVQHLPQGLATAVGERGVLLSGGQKQRLAIARALLRNTEVVVLDEATSALDNQSEKMVQQALETLMAERTVLVIAHRLSTITHADTIVVMEEGLIVEQGTHSQLLAAGGAYAALYQAQFKVKEPAEAPHA
jgi:subfamily B ATP-binding cassette protein MsbA